jgi:alanine-glyoxylate transaminase/serine-glyoxylate transaminase/serine-pyruvate transaminase
VRLEKPWGEVFTDAEAREFIRRERPQVVAYVQAETSTGAFQMGVAAGAAAREVGALVIADVVTSLGGMPVQVDASGVDVAYSCTQKALACVPGLAPITVSARALEWLRTRKAPIPDWYFDLRLLDDYYHGAAHRYHHTTPVSTFYALREALAVIAEEGVEQRWKRHLQAHRAFVAGIEAMGLHMHVADPHRLWTLNTPCVPEGVDDVKVRRRMLAEDSIEILGGFGPLTGKIFRIGLMGRVATRENVGLLLDSMQRALAAEGYQAKANGREAAEALFA